MGDAATSGLRAHDLSLDLRYISELSLSDSVCHDLCGPWRAIAGFTGLLRDRHYETIDAEGCLIDRVLTGMRRMSSLIDNQRERAGHQSRTRT